MKNWKTWNTGKTSDVIGGWSMFEKLKLVGMNWLVKVHATTEGKEKKNTVYHKITM